MFIHPQIGLELARDRQREMLASARHRRLTAMLAAARADQAGARRVPFRLLGVSGLRLAWEA